VCHGRLCLQNLVSIITSLGYVDDNFFFVSDKRDVMIETRFCRQKNLSTNFVDKNLSLTVTPQSLSFNVFSHVFQKLCNNLRVSDILEWEQGLLTV
jgi:hypothetical protein